MNARIAFASLAATLFATACVAEGPPGPGPGDDDDVIDPDPEPQPEPEPEPEPLACDGAYQVETDLDVQAAAVMPQSVYDAVDVLRGLRDNPGETLFDLAEEAGVPAVEDIRDALPSQLEDRVYGWIDDKVQTFTTGDGPVAVVIDGIVDASETVIAECALSSELTIENGAAIHRLREIAFVVSDAELRYDLAGLPGVITEDTATATVGAGVDAAPLAVGEHTFGLPYGELALRALEDTLQARMGADLRGALGQLIDCPAIAAWVADRCVWGQCVGHEADLLAVCEAGLDEATAQIRGKFAAARFDALVLQSGTATLRDGTPADGVASTIEGGVWTAEIDAGFGPRPAPATFTGLR